MIPFILSVLLPVLLASITMPVDRRHYTNYVTYPVSVEHPSLTHAKYTHTLINIPQKHYNMTGSLYVLENPAQHFHIYVPEPKGCGTRERTSRTAKEHGCVVATNAGFFRNVPRREHLRDYCLGSIVSDGKMIRCVDAELGLGSSRDTAITGSTPSSLGGSANGAGPKVAFGMTKGGAKGAEEPSFVAGWMDCERIWELNVVQYVSGVIWLVREGKMFVNESREIEKESISFVRLAAPRTAIGHNKEGHLMIAVINGNEGRRQGPDLWTFAKILMDHGAYNMVNVDGGGSSTVVDHGRIISDCCDRCPEREMKDHCPNSPTRCERQVTSVTCIT